MSGRGGHTWIAGGVGGGRSHHLVILRVMCVVGREGSRGMGAAGGKVEGSAITRVTLSTNLGGGVLSMGGGVATLWG